MTEHLPLRQILVGDARARLQELPDASIDCVITSPPYFQLRDYKHQQQIGTETTVDAWAEQIAAVCAELGRVMTPRGSLWLNLSDCYSRHHRDGATKKSLLLAPQRVAMRMTQQGWLLRNVVIWAKKNPMPSSVGDRLTNSHEVVYFFTKQPDYYFNLDAIREPAEAERPAKRRTPVATYPPREAVLSLGNGSSPRVDLNSGLAGMKATGRNSHPLGKNPGDVWSLATANYRGAHFATFPMDLVRRPLLATCPQQVCTNCGAPWHRATKSIHGRKLATGKLKPTCLCQAVSRPGVVLDPFLGSGTVALAAEAHGRNWIGIELNPEYAQLARERLEQQRGT